MAGTSTFAATSRSTTNSATIRVVEHPVFFNMGGLSENPESEIKILQGLNDLVHSKYSDLHFLFAGRVLESKGVPFTHALISRFPSAPALQIYYDSAIKEIAAEMGPWFKNEFCVDYVVEMEEAAVVHNVTKDLAAHVTFIKVSSNVSDSDIKGAIDAFLGLVHKSDYATQLTAGENLYIREYYRTMSHAFCAYFPSVDALKKWKEDPAVLSVFQDTILPLADSFATISLVPFVAPNDVDVQ